MIDRPLLYLHIPFCDSKCFYCSFNSYTNLHNFKDRYVEALIQQFKFEAERFGEKFKTLYIGGGTPSTLSPNQLEKIFKTVSPHLLQDIEITIEANPNSASTEWLKGVRDLGANRVSLGVQSFNSEKLKFLGRNHSRESAIQSIETASKVGFQNINIDFIYDTAVDTKELLQNDIDTLFSLPVNHVSMYSLTLEENTLFESRDDVQKESLKMSQWLIDKVGERFPQYEISNFGKPSQHNLGYWSGDNYAGVGSGAVGFLKNRRLYPTKDLKKYIENPLSIDVEEISENDLIFEKIFLGLRSKVGVEKSILNDDEVLEAEALVDSGILKSQAGRYYNSNYMLSDEIALRLCRGN